MGGTASKDSKAPTTPKGDRMTPPTGGDVNEPKGEPILTQKFETFQTAQKSEPGFGADDDDNQDVLLTKTLGEDVQLFAMFDGHGHEGKMVADACKECCLDVLAANLNKVDKEKEKDVVKEELKSAFLELDKKVCANDDVDTTQSGASVTLIIYDVKNKGLLVGNVGDTKVVIGNNKPGEKSITPKMLTEDHYPGVAAEKARIEAAGGRVGATDDVQLGELGGARVWKGDSDVPGLPLSRTIGDEMAKGLGVTANAALKKVTLTAGDRFLVLASGGIWKVISPQEVVDMVAQDSDPASACDALLKEASTRWEDLWQGENTTVTIVVFPTA